MPGKAGPWTADKRGQKGVPGGPLTDERTTLVAPKLDVAKQELSLLETVELRAHKYTKGIEIDFLKGWAIFAITTCSVAQLMLLSCLWLSGPSCC